MNSMTTESLAAYLERHIKAGVIDFSIRAELLYGGTGVHFYIHPAQESGDTRDYLTWVNPENDMDLLINRELCPQPDSETFLQRLNAMTPTQKDQKQ